MQLRQEFKQALQRLGVRQTGMYQQGGQVRVGYGHPLPDSEAACALPFVLPEKGEAATREQIAAAWEGAGQAGAAEGPQLPEETIDELLAADIEAALVPIRGAVPDFEKLPPYAQEVVAEMALRRGEAIMAIIKEEPLIQAIGRADFVAAQGLCAEDEVGRWQKEQMVAALAWQKSEAEIAAQVDELFQSLGQLADVARTQLKKLEAQFGEMADEIAVAARGFIKELSAHAAELNLKEIIDRDLAPLHAEAEALGKDLAARRGEAVMADAAADQTEPQAEPEGPAQPAAPGDQRA